MCETVEKPLKQQKADLEKSAFCCFRIKWIYPVFWFEINVLNLFRISLFMLILARLKWLNQRDLSLFDKITEQTKNIKEHLLKLSNGVNTLGDSITQMLIENKTIKVSNNLTSFIVCFYRFCKY